MDPFERSRSELEQRLVAAALDLFAHTQTAALLVPVPNTTPTIYVAAGEPEKIRRLLP